MKEIMTTEEYVLTSINNLTRIADKQNEILESNVNWRKDQMKINEELVDQNLALVKAVRVNSENIKFMTAVVVINLIGSIGILVLFT